VILHKLPFPVLVVIAVLIAAFTRSHDQPETAYRYWGDAQLSAGKVDEARTKYLEALIADPLGPAQSRRPRDCPGLRNLPRLEPRQHQALPEGIRSPENTQRGGAGGQLALSGAAPAVTWLPGAPSPSTFYLLRQHLLSRFPCYSADALQYP
jgi:hypothetical protein